mmetsp:Transcript_13440/g.26608  ORF Transcript_13440/g.26608 Transcript_13440/m.26608 type:complete len:90 (+) Transcript_13440:1773-2042(+)
MNSEEGEEAQKEGHTRKSSLPPTNAVIFMPGEQSAHRATGKKQRKKNKQQTALFPTAAGSKRDLLRFFHHAINQIVILTSLFKAKRVNG